ncbi:MAG TPA: hypothetical protein VF762_10940 [Blastocatellia bacterium]|jgi:flagellar basal body-associated protein FliL
MSSEIIVVLVMTVIAIGFIIWVRSKSQPEGHDGQPTNQARSNERADQ